MSADECNSDHRLSELTCILSFVPSVKYDKPQHVSERTYEKLKGVVPSSWIPPWLKKAVFVLGQLTWGFQKTVDVSHTLCYILLQNVLQ